eukprot:CAMPEP_0184503352 /NCGR_PEP_ID=MMETSP0113_2-20130426/51842_1 /TAXON_ID=91329 /ORGANISM="Norrisiella sphaerica, Strain BC52" /LENGTH=753 /DNA_ID=CAMNT_0026892835 /DNA_START=2188 /DNA_END=4446 /DNA_ORIENTATION=+
MIKTGHLRSVFFDEIDQVVFDKDWRPSLDHALELISAMDVVKVFCTATANDYIVDTLKKGSLSRPSLHKRADKDVTHVHRKAPERSELYYAVDLTASSGSELRVSVERMLLNAAEWYADNVTCAHERGDLANVSSGSMCSLFEHMLRHYKAIVFGESIRKINDTMTHLYMKYTAVSSHINVAHNGMCDGHNDDMNDRWCAPSGSDLPNLGLLGATDKCSRGVSSARTWCVVLQDIPSTITTWCQRVGRGARKWFTGEIAYAGVVLSQMSPFPTLKSEGKDGVVIAPGSYKNKVLEWMYMVAFVSTTRCRRIILKRYYDECHKGTEYDMAIPCHNCDNCSGDDKVKKDYIKEIRRLLGILNVVFEKKLREPSLREIVSIAYGCKNATVDAELLKQLASHRASKKCTFGDGYRLLMILYFDYGLIDGPHFNRKTMGGGFGITDKGRQVLERGCIEAGVCPYLPRWPRKGGKVTFDGLNVNDANDNVKGNGADSDGGDSTASIIDDLSASISVPGVRLRMTKRKRRYVDALNDVVLDQAEADSLMFPYECMPYPSIVRKGVLLASMPPNTSSFDVHASQTLSDVPIKIKERMKRVAVDVFNELENERKNNRRNAQRRRREDQSDGFEDDLKWDLQDLDTVVRHRIVFPDRRRSGRDMKEIADEVDKLMTSGSMRGKKAEAVLVKRFATLHQKAVLERMVSNFEPNRKRRLKGNDLIHIATTLSSKHHREPDWVNVVNEHSVWLQPDVHKALLSAVV